MTGELVSKQTLNPKLQTLNKLKTTNSKIIIITKMLRNQDYPFTTYCSPFTLYCLLILPSPLATPARLLRHSCLSSRYALREGASGNPLHSNSKQQTQNSKQTTNHKLKTFRRNPPDIPLPDTPACSPARSLTTDVGVASRRVCVFFLSSFLATCYSQLIYYSRLTFYCSLSSQSIL